MVEKESEILAKAFTCSELMGINLYDLLTKENKGFDDWVYCCQQRINEEINKRMETGICTKFKDLCWSVPGDNGWPHYPEQDLLPMWCYK